MPALFAYLIAVGLLLGGGYGALNWLAAPEPTKVAAKAKPKPLSTYEASSEMPSRAPGPAEAGNPGRAVASNSDKTASTSNAQSTSEGTEPAAGPDAQAEASNLAADRHIRSAHAEMTVEQKPQAGDDQRPAEAAPPVVPANIQAGSATPPPAGAKAVKRLHLRQATRHPERPTEKRPLALMVLRTIEYPDGRRVSRLLPYRARRDALAFGPDE